MVGPQTESKSTACEKYIFMHVDNLNLDYHIYNKIKKANALTGAFDYLHQNMFLQLQLLQFLQSGTATHWVISCDRGAA